MGFNHVRTLANFNSLCAIADTNFSKAKTIATKYQVPAYPSLNQLISQANPDAIIIAVPTKFHFSLAKTCLQHRLPTFVEKPIASTIKQAQTLINLSRQQQTLFVVGHIERYNPVLQKFKQLLKRDVLGQITTLLSIRVGVQPPQFRPADVLTDLAIHDVDIFTYLLEELPTSIHINKRSLTNSTGSDTASILLQYPSADALIQANWITPIKKRQLFVTGTKGYVELDYVTQQLLLYRQPLPIKPKPSFKAHQAYSQVKAESIKIKKQEPLLLELQTFIKQCHTYKQTKSYTADYPLNALKIVHAQL